MPSVLQVKFINVKKYNGITIWYHHWTMTPPQYFFVRDAPLPSTQKHTHSLFHKHSPTGNTQPHARKQTHANPQAACAHKHNEKHSNLLPGLRVSQRCGNASSEHQTRGRRKTNDSRDAQLWEEKIQPSSNHLIWSCTAAEKTRAAGSGENTSLSDPHKHTILKSRTPAPFLQPLRCIQGSRTHSLELRKY